MSEQLAQICELIEEYRAAYDRGARSRFDEDRLLAEIAAQRADLRALRATISWHGDRLTRLEETRR
jgi:hypothetical protein